MEADESGRSSNGCGVRFFGLFWTAFSSIFLCVGLWMIWGALEAWQWKTVPCVIERFEITADNSQDPPFRPDLVYRYEVDARKYTGSRLWTGKEGSDKYEDLAEVRERFSMGPEGPLAEIANVPAECRVKPDEPETSALMSSGSGQIWGGLVFTMMGGFFVLIGLALIFARPGKPVKSISGKGHSNHPVAAVIAFLFFGGAGLAMLCGFVLPKAFEWFSMRAWKETEAQVIWSRITSKSNSDGTTYAVDIFYRYQVDGREYRSNRYSVLGGSSSGSKKKNEIVRAHPRESKLMVFVDPAKPWRAVINRSMGWWCLIALFPLPFIAVGAFGLGAMYKKRLDGPSVSTRPRSRGHVAAARAHRLGAKPLPAGEWVQAGNSRIGGFLGLLFFALIWNGMLFFFQKSFGGEKTIGLFTLLIVPFCLIGIALAFGVVYTFASIFAPRFDLQIASDDLKPGRSVRLQWRRAGGYGQPADFTLLLVGREEATYCQGSSNTTVRSVFHEDVLFETTIPQVMDAGGVSLRIPDDAVPTFMGSNNRIMWRVCLLAKVPWFPDVRDDREIVVKCYDSNELP